MPLAIFGIENTALNLVVTFAILCLFAIWLALIVFTFTDARRRISDPFLVGCATAASLFPFVGTVVYAILRPPEFLEDIHERETEVRASEVRLRHLEEHSCHKCGFPTESDFIRCPSCRTRLKEECPSCAKPVGMSWKVCPYCETALVAPKRSRSGSSKSRSEGDGSGKRSSRRSSKDGAAAPASSSTSSSSSSRSGGSSSGRTKKATSSSGSSSSSGSRSSEKTREARTSRSGSDTEKAPTTRRTPRSTRRKPAGDGDGAVTKPINSGDKPSPTGTPKSR